MDLKKYHCDECDYHCAFPSQLKKHVESSKHNNGVRKQRKDKVLESECKICGYATANLTSMRVHTLTKHSTKEERAREFKYYCQKCDFGTMADILFQRHLETKKHCKKCETEQTN